MDYSNEDTPWPSLSAFFVTSDIEFAPKCGGTLPDAYWIWGSSDYLQSWGPFLESLDTFRVTVLSVSSKPRRLEARNSALILIFIPLIFYSHMKRPTLQNKLVAALRMAFWARKVIGTFQKQASEHVCFLSPWSAWFLKLFNCQCLTSDTAYKVYALLFLCPNRF